MLYRHDTLWLWVDEQDPGWSRSIDPRFAVVAQCRFCSTWHLMRPDAAAVCAAPTCAGIVEQVRGTIADLVTAAYAVGGGAAVMEMIAQDPQAWASGSSPTGSTST